MLIYKTTNLINGMEYIGFDTKDRGELKYLGSGRKLYEDIIKYGKVNFKKRILCYCDTMKDLRQAEVEYVELYNTFKGYGYNLNPGGNGVGIGHKHTNETKKKISETNKGRKLSESHKKKLSEAKKGKKHSEEHKKKNSEAQKGRKHSEETKEKMKQPKSDEWKKNAKGRNTWSKGRKLSEEHKKNISLSCKNRKYKPHTDEAKKKISEANKGNRAWNRQNVPVDIIVSLFKNNIKISVISRKLNISRDIIDYRLKEQGLK